MSELNNAAPITPEDLFGDILNYVENAQTIMASGQWVELYGLDAQVEKLCAVVAALSPEQAKEYAPELDFVREQIISLGEQMEALHKKLHLELKETDILARANRAYAVGNNLKEPTSES